jgi:NAD(P)-dependent dehydrogenase (short-subunit alcohol dehydrogenase family)
MTNLSGKRVLVTGASAGIGAALALGAAERGATVAICARRTDKLQSVLAKLQSHSAGSRAYPIDLTDLDALEGFATQVDDDLGGIDVLINNAGMPKRRTVMLLDPDTVDRVMHLNYSSPVRLTLALLPRFIARGADIINISSVAARLSPPAEAAYAASKAALTAWSESMHVDLGIAGHPVRVHVVNPGVFDTELFDLPDNDPFTAPVDKLPVADIVAPVLDLVGHDTFEIYVPEWFGDVVGHKFPDTTAFLAGSIGWAREQAGT